MLAQGPTGTPEPIEPSHILLKAAYVKSGDVQRGIESASTTLDNPEVNLIAKLPSPEGPPIQTALVFSFRGEQTITYQVGTRDFHGIPSRVYDVAEATGNYSWESDIAQSKPGYFLVGSVQAANLWRVARTEVDCANRRNFTLVPVALPHGLPSLDFSLVADADIRQEVQ